MDNNTVGAGSLDLTNRFALDVQGFDAMRAAASAAPQQGVKMAAKQFDAVFTEMMLKSMREATPDDGPLDSRDGDQFTSMLDQQLSQQMSNRGIGVASAMIKQLTRSMGGGNGDGAGAGGAAGMLSGSGSDSDSDSNAGNLAMLNALGRAYGNAAASGSLAHGSPYDEDSALTPPTRGNSDDDAVNAFVGKLANAAQRASAVTGIPARFMIGQAALESGWGKREIRKADGSSSHNVFGIKATKDWTGKTVATVTTEYYGGKPHRVVEKFRVYDSYEEAMADYANLLKDNPRYASVIADSHSAEGFAQGMQHAGYATDPHYARKLLSIMRQMV